MPQENDSSRLGPERVGVWLRGCVLTGGVGFAALLALSVPLYLAHQRPCPSAPPERINPNTASMASLVRLPNIGKARAMDIIHFRENSGGEEQAFKTAGDLEAIKGIGPKTVENLSPWLVFKEEPRINTNEH